MCSVAPELGEKWNSCASLLVQGRLLVHAIPFFCSPRPPPGAGGAVLTNAFDDNALTAEPGSWLDFELYNRLCIILSSQLFLSWFSIYKMLSLQPLYMCIIIVFVSCKNRLAIAFQTCKSAKIFACGAQKNMDLHEQTLHERNFGFGEIHARGATEHISECERPKSSVSIEVYDQISWFCVYTKFMR